MQDELAELKQSLLRGWPTALTPSQGDEAFERHQLLAIRFHRAARLNQTVKGEGKGWMQFFGEHFPRGDAHADLLWTTWRLGLVKDEQPLEGVVITHGQPGVHWFMTNLGLCIDLESMWADFAKSVDHMVDQLRSDSTRRADVLRAFRERQWTVQTVVAAGLNVSASFSASAMGPLPRR